MQTFPSTIQALNDQHVYRNPAGDTNAIKIQNNKYTASNLGFVGPLYIARLFTTKTAETKTKSFSIAMPESRSKIEMSKKHNTFHKFAINIPSVKRQIYCMSFSDGERRHKLRNSSLANNKLQKHVQLTYKQLDPMHFHHVQPTKNRYVISKNITYKGNFLNHLFSESCMSNNLIDFMKQHCANQTN